MDRPQEAAAEAARRSYIQLLNKLTGYIVTGNIRDLRNTCEALHKIICSENQEFLLSMQNDSGNPLFQTNLIIFACKNEQYKVLEYLFNNGKKILLALYEKIGTDFIHPRYTDSFEHNALYYAIRSSNTKLVDLLIEKWPGFDVGKNIECFEDALSISYQDLRLRNVELSSEMEFCVESRLVDFRLALSEKHHNPGVTVTQIILRLDWLISKIHRTLDEDNGDQTEILLQNLKTIAKNIYVLKSLLKSTYDVIPWEEMEFCLAIFVRSQSSKDELNILYWSFISKSALMSHLKNFTECLEAEKIAIQNKHNVNILKSLPSVKRAQAVKMITKKYPFFHSLYHDFERSRDVRSLAVMNEYMNASLTADTEEKNDRLIIVRTLQVVGQCFQNTFENPMLTDEARKRLFSNLEGSTRKIIIDIRNSLSSSFVLSKRAEKEDEETIKFFSELHSDIRRLNKAAKNMIDTSIFQQVKRYFRILVDCDEQDTVDEIMKSLCSIKSGVLAVSGNIPMLQVLVDTLRYKAEESPMNLDAVYIYLENANYFLAKVDCRVLSVPALDLLKEVIQMFVMNTAFEIINNEQLQRIAKELVNIFSEYKEVKLSLNLGFEVINFLDTIAARLSKDEYYEVYMLVSEIINIIDLLDDNTELVEELRTRLRNHNDVFLFDFYEPYPTPDKKNKNVISASIAKPITEIRSIIRHVSCNDKTKNYQLHCKEEKSAQLILELLMVETLYFMGHSQECYQNNHAYVDARVPLLYGPNLLDYLIHKSEMTKIYLHDPEICVANNARLIASGSVIGNRRYLNDKEAFYDMDALTEQDWHISSVIFFQEQLFTALSDGNMCAVNLCLKNGADIFGRNCKNTTALHYAAKETSSESLKYVLDQWTGKTYMRNMEGANPLHLAVYKGKLENAKLLLTRGNIPVDAPDDFGRTGLHYSVSTAYTDVTKMLLMFKADPNAIDQEGRTPLKQALSCKNIEASKLILEHEKFCYDDTAEPSPLDIAAENGLSELLPTLIKQEANARNKNQTKKMVHDLPTPLHYAAKNGHLECIKILLQNGWNVDVKALDGDTPLYCGVLSNKEDVVQFILESGADAKDCKSFLWAAENGNTKIIEILLAGKASVNIVDPTSGITPLHRAVRYDKRDAVELLAKNGARINAKDNKGQTPLHYCSQRGYYELSKVLMKYGAKTNVGDKFGCFPHSYAVLAGNQEIVELMVTSTNVNAVDSKGYTALHCSCREGYASIVRCLLDKGAKVNVKANNRRTPLHIAAMNGSHEIVNLLLEKGAPINDADSFGSTPLQYAAAFGRTQVIKILMQRGANINQVNPHGYTPLHLACTSGSSECTTLLINKGRSMINLKTRNGTTPLRMAVEGNYKSIVELLIKNKVKIEEDAVEEAVQSGFGVILELLLNVSPAHVKKSKLLLIAAVNRRPEIIKILVKRGADINGKCNMIGDRPLHGAVSNGDAEIVQVLLDLGANPNAKSCVGDIPMHLAAKLGHFETVVVLLKHKSKILAKDSKGRTSLDFAVGNGHADVVELFLNHDKTININNCFSTDQRWPLLHIGAQSGKLDVVKLLVEKGANINHKIDTGSKAIHIAAREGFADIVEFFLSKGISLYDSGTGGNNLLHYISHGSGDRLKVAKLLVCNKHMDLNRVNKGGLTPLHIAVCLSEDLQLIKLFMSNGAYFDVKDFCGNAVKDIAKSFPTRLIFHSVQQLFTGAKRGDLSQVQNTIRQGAVVDAKNERNETPLLCATWKGNSEVVNELLAKGANPDITGKSGSTPLHYASKTSHYAIVLALLGGGAVFESRNEGNKTPLDYASDEKILKVLKLIQDAFLKIKVGDVEVLKSLRKLKLRPDEVRALFNCRDRDGKTIVACAVLADFPDNKCFQSIFRVNQDLEKAEKLLDSGRSREALAIAKSERTKWEAMFSDDSMMNADVDLVISLSLHEEHRFDEALLALQKLHETFKKMLGDDEKSTMNIESLMAVVLEKKGEIKRALRLFETVNEKQKSVLGPLHPDLIQTQINMGTALMSVGQLERALELNDDLVERCKVVYGGDHPTTLVVRNDNAKILLQKGRHDEALEIHKQVLEKRKNLLGPKHRETLQTMVDIGYVYFCQKKFKDAVSMIVDAMKIQSGTLDKFCDGSKSDVMSAIFLSLKQGKMFNIFKEQPDHEYRDEQEMRIPGEFFESMKRFRGRGIFMDDEEDVISPTNLPASLSNILDIVTRISTEDVMSQMGLNVVRSSRNEEDIFNNFFDRLTINYFQDVKVGESNDDSVVEERIDKTTAFQLIASGDAEVVGKMIDSKIDFNATDEEGRTPLHFAVSSGSVHLVESLIENGAEVKGKSNKGNTPLHTAALLEREDIAEILLKNVKDAERCTFIDSQTSKSGMTALHIAASKGKFEVVKTLLKNGATYNATNNEHKSPLDLSVNEEVTSTLNRLDNVFKTVAATINSVKGLSSEDWNIMSASRNAEGGALLTEIVKCKDLLDTMIRANRSSVPKTLKRKLEGVDKKD